MVNKISYLAGLLIPLIILFAMSSCSNDPTKDELRNILWYQQPASDWFSALPLGNGKLGAMVYGGTETEHIQLNEETLWAGVPEDPIPENLKEHYAVFRRMNLEGDYEKAFNYAMQHLAISPTSIRSYQPFGDLFITFNNHETPGEYRRELNLQTGINKVSYTIDGRRFVRESFVSTRYNTVFHHFKSLDGEPVTSKIYFRREATGRKVPYDKDKDIKQIIKDNRLIIDGQIFDDPDGYDDNEGGSGEGGYHMKFAGMIGIAGHSGDLSVSGKELVVEKAREFTVMVTAATDYNVNTMDFGGGISPVSVCEKTLNHVSGLDYEMIKADHITCHSAMMNRVQFNITSGNTDSLPTDIRLANLTETRKDKRLTELFFQYGRYLLLASSGGNAVLPVNLQGIWNKDMWAAWESDFHLNINLQMNYWPADVCNLSETMQPLSVFMQNLSKKGYVTASKFLDTEGWMAPHCTNAFGRTTPSGSTYESQVSNGYCFPLAGAWMSITLWRHYEFTQDKLYLQETAYPVLHGAARFILDFLVENDKGELVTVPSYSPENKYIDSKSGKVLKNTIAATIDIQIIRDVFNACLQSEEILGKETELTPLLREAMRKLPEMKIGKDGTIQEWYEDYEEAEPGHRHISHLYGLYPSNQINPGTPELFEAAKKTLAKRLSYGGGQTGWSRAWMISFYARLFNGNECNNHISSLIANQVCPNLFDLHPPHIFQIDGNLGAAAGIAEMLLQSHEENNIRILPALPDDWEEGYIKGLKARGGLVVDIFWKNNCLEKVIIKSGFKRKFNLIYNDTVVPVAMDKGDVYTYINTDR